MKDSFYAIHMTVECRALVQNYGFIKPAHGGNIFFHFSSIDSEEQCPVSVGDTLEFRIGTDKTGRPCAVDVQLTTKSSKASLRTQRQTLSTLG
jgi:cold shock CspA family protein